MDQPRGYFDAEELPDELLGLVKPELAPGERLLWVGQSRARLADGDSLVTSSLWAAGCFLVAAVGFVLVFPLAPRFQDIEKIVALISFICGAIGVFLSIYVVSNAVRFRVPRGDASLPTYALTDRRAIFWSPHGRSGGVTIHTLPRGSVKIEHVHRVQYPDGSGDLMVRNAYEAPNGFTGIADVRRVEELVRRFLVDPESEPS